MHGGDGDDDLLGLLPTYGVDNCTHSEPAGWAVVYHYIRLICLQI